MKKRGKILSNRQSEEAALAAVPRSDAALLSRLF